MLIRQRLPGSLGAVQRIPVFVLPDLGRKFGYITQLSSMKYESVAPPKP